MATPLEVLKIQHIMFVFMTEQLHHPGVQWGGGRLNSFSAHRMERRSGGFTLIRWSVWWFMALH